MKVVSARALGMTFARQAGLHEDDFLENLSLNRQTASDSYSSSMSLVKLTELLCLLKK